MMVKMKMFIFSLNLALFLGLFLIKEGSAYQQIDTPRGKIIFEIGKREALEKFGVPESADEEAWHYILPEEFFVYFPRVQSVSLFPRESQVALFVPLELKVLESSVDLEIKDVTSAAEIIYSQPQSFLPGDHGTVIPKEAGNYIILAKYKNIFSNPCYLTVKENSEKGLRKEKLLCIDILPNKPEISSGEKLQFKAFGTFLDLSNNKYFVKEINYGADWFLQDGQRKLSVRNGLIDFPISGKFKVICRYNDLQSYSQECVVRNQALPRKETLKHITLLPDFTVVFSGNSLSLRAFGTYSNNKVEEITDQVSWKISRKDLLKQIPQPTKKEALFLTESAGMVSVLAELDDLRSLPVKIAVVGAAEENKKSDSSPLPSEFYQDKKNEIDFKDLTREIKNNAEKLSDAFSGKSRKLTAIKISPDFLRTSLGEEAQISALGIYSDNSQEDLTFIGNWVSSNEKIASVMGGKITSFSTGEVNFYPANDCGSSSCLYYHTIGSNGNCRDTGRRAEMGRFDSDAGLGVPALCVGRAYLNKGYIEWKLPG